MEWRAIRPLCPGLWLECRSRMSRKRERRTLDGGVMPDEGRRKPALARLIKQASD
jgi:hypothetical protein